MKRIVRIIIYFLWEVMLLLFPNAPVWCENFGFDILWSEVGMKGRDRYGRQLLGLNLRLFSWEGEVCYHWAKLLAILLHFFYFYKKKKFPSLWFILSQVYCLQTMQSLGKKFMFYSKLNVFPLEKKKRKKKNRPQTSYNLTWGFTSEPNLTVNESTEACKASYAI